MSKVVLIAGDLAAGKSTLANNLSLVTQYPFVSKDTIKEIICDSVGFSTREENRKISVSAVNLMIYFLNQTLKIGGDLILEANFRLSEINEIIDICKNYNSDLKIISLTGQTNVLYERFLNRVPNRHKAHLSMGLDKDYNKFVEYILDLRNQLKHLTTFNVDVTNNDEKKVLEKVLVYLSQK